MTEVLSQDDNIGEKVYLIKGKKCYTAEREAREKSVINRPADMQVREGGGRVKLDLGSRMGEVFSFFVFVFTMKICFNWQ